jgi:1-phosphatidylinositol-4-phosphate 5-kinase
MIFQAGEGAGASGSFFFYSHDRKLLIKTLKNNEKAILLGFLEDYVKHIVDSDNCSLLARIYGLYTIKSSVFSPLDVIIMQNTADLHD